MFKNLFIISIATIVSGCVTTYVKKDNPSIVASEGDVSKCKVEAHEKAPPKIQTQDNSLAVLGYMMKKPENSTTSTSCYGAGNYKNCTTNNNNSGYNPPPQTIEKDLNDSNSRYPPGIRASQACGHFNFCRHNHDPHALKACPNTA